MSALRIQGEIEPPDAGDLIVLLLASSLTGLRDRLHEDGFEKASDFVAELVEITDDYIWRREQQEEDAPSA